MASTETTAATRLDDLRAWMASSDVEAAYVTRPVSIAYLTGVQAEPYERLMALAVRGDRVTLIVPAIEVENAERAKTSADIVSWRDGEDPYRLVHRALHGTARLGVEKEHLSVAAAEALRERTDSTVVPAAGVVGEAMVALILAAAYREKLGGDHIGDALGALAAYRERIGWRR